MMLKIFALAASLGLAATLAGAETSLPAPADDPILTVTGAIAATNAEGAAILDRAWLEALPAESFETSTLWTEGVRTFTGVPLHVLLETLGSTGSVLRAQAINDYAVEIPVGDAVPGGPIVAYALDGAPMSVRDKGPLWIVYPYDSSPDYQTEVIYSRSIWQLDRIDVLP